MLIHRSGWNERMGSFQYQIPVDDQRVDYRIYFTDGSHCEQISPFNVEVQDWNSDGDRYGQCGAWFEYEEGDRHFLRSEDMLAYLEEGTATIPGIPDPWNDFRKNNPLIGVNLNNPSYSINYRTKRENYCIPFDTTRTYKIKMANGRVFRQLRPFEYHQQGNGCPDKIGAEFQDDFGFVCFFTPKALIHLAFVRAAEIEGVPDVPSFSWERPEPKTKRKHRQEQEL